VNRASLLEQSRDELETAAENTKEVRGVSSALIAQCNVAIDHVIACHTGPDDFRGEEFADALRAIREIRLGLEELERMASEHEETLS
jgi:hypothetical protein